MKSKDIIEKFKKMSDQELKTELEKNYNEARKARLEVEANKSQDSASIKKMRLDIARLLTVLNSRGSE